MASALIAAVTLSGAHIFSLAKVRGKAQKADAQGAAVHYDEKKINIDAHAHNHVDRLALKSAASAIHADSRSLRKYLQLDQKPEFALLD